MKKPVISGNTITIPSDPEFICTVDDFIEEILRGYGANESVIADIAISVSELVNNSINHGNELDEDKPVVISIKREKETVVITILDEGSGFDPAAIADPLAEENLLKDAGRGIFIVKALMDYVEVEAHAKGTKVTITKAIK